MNIISSIRNDMNEDLLNISKSYTFNELFKVSQYQKELNTIKLLDSVIFIFSE